MGRRTLVATIVTVGLICCFASSTCRAEVNLRFTPADTVITVGDASSLSIQLDDAVDVRSFEVWVQYDPDLLTNVDGSPGRAFTESGCFMFEGIEEDTLGVWHGYVVILDAECWITGPGELFAWEFTADEIGVSPITAVDVALYAPQVGELEGVQLSGTTIRVSDVIGVDDLVRPGLNARAVPNPFNPRTEIEFELATAQAVDLEVYDVLGRQVCTLVRGEQRESGHHRVPWSGRDDSGKSVSAGVYFFYLRVGGEVEVGRMVLVR